MTNPSIRTALLATLGFTLAMAATTAFAGDTSYVVATGERGGEVHRTYSDEMEVDTHQFEYHASGEAAAPLRALIRGINGNGASVSQNGRNNTANINQSGTGHDAHIGQYGNNNNAKVGQNGQDHVVGVVQFTNNHTVEIEQNGTADTTLVIVHQNYRGGKRK